jgi:hypothetical protein
VVIPRAPIEIFETAADPYAQLKWDPGTLKQVEKLTPGPLAPGTRYRGEFKGFGVVEYQFTAYDPGKRFAHHAVMNIGDMQHIFEFATAPEGTLLTQTLLVEPAGIGKLLAPIMPLMLRRRLRAINLVLKQYVTSPAWSPQS